MGSGVQPQVRNARTVSEVHCAEVKTIQSAITVTVMVSCGQRMLDWGRQMHMLECCLFRCVLGRVLFVGFLCARHIRIIWATQDSLDAMGR
jgi:hypothetical protein